MIEEETEIIKHSILNKESKIDICISFFNKEGVVLQYGRSLRYDKDNDDMMHTEASFDKNSGKLKMEAIDSVVKMWARMLPLVVTKKKNREKITKHMNAINTIGGSAGSDWEYTDDVKEFLKEIIGDK